MVILKLKKAVINTSVHALQLRLFLWNMWNFLWIKNLVVLHAQLIEFKLRY